MDTFNTSQPRNHERHGIPGPMKYRLEVLASATVIIDAAAATYPVTATTTQETTLSPNTQNIKFATSPYSIVQKESGTTSNTDINVEDATRTAQAEAVSSDKTIAEFGDIINAG